MRILDVLHPCNNWYCQFILLLILSILIDVIYPCFNLHVLMINHVDWLFICLAFTRLRIFFSEVSIQIFGLFFLNWVWFSYCWVLGILIYFGCESFGNKIFLIKEFSYCLECMCDICRPDHRQLQRIISQVSWGKAAPPHQAQYTANVIQSVKGVVVKDSDTPGLACSLYAYIPRPRTCIPRSFIWDFGLSFPRAPLLRDLLMQEEGRNLKTPFPTLT